MNLRDFYPIIITVYCKLGTPTSSDHKNQVFIF